MGYQGLRPSDFVGSYSNILQIDTPLPHSPGPGSGFNGTQTAFKLQYDGVDVGASLESLVVVLGGVTQRPTTDYTYSNGVITFTTAPQSNLTIDIRRLQSFSSELVLDNDVVGTFNLNLTNTANPTNGVEEGDIYYNTTENELRVYNGTEWDTAGGGGGLVSADFIEKLLFIHHGGFTANTTIGSPQKFAEIFSHADATIDIETGVTVDIDDDSSLLVTDKTDFDMDFMANGASGTNLQRATRFDDKVRTSVTSDISLTGNKKVGYAQIPTYLQADVPFDIDNSVTVTVDDGAVLII